MFSTGVILFIIVQGIFPFKEAKPDEYFYNLIINNKLDTYWNKVGGNSLTEEFKDLILRMFSYDPTKRPTVDELKSHPWMNLKLDIKESRRNLQAKLHEARSQKTADTSSRSGASVRGDNKLELVREMPSVLDAYRFNDQTDFDIDVAPGVVWDELNTFNEDCYEGKLTIEENQEKRCFMLTQVDEEDPSNNL